MEQIDRIREIVDRVAAAESLELVDVEIVGRGRNAVLRIFLDKPGGIAIRDCEQVSRQVGAILDVEDLLPGRYTLEVSSPGLDRRLVKLYGQQLGDHARMHTRWLSKRFAIRPTTESRANNRVRLVGS